MTDTVFDIKEIANLPDNVVVSQKFGMKYDGHEKYLHSCGIMYNEERRVFYCIMTKGMEKDYAEKFIGGVVNRVYNYTVETGFPEKVQIK